MYGSWTLLDFVRLGFIQTYDCADGMIIPVLNIGYIQQHRVRFYMAKILSFVLRRLQDTPTSTFSCLNIVNKNWSKHLEKSQAQTLPRWREF